MCLQSCLYCVCSQAFRSFIAMAVRITHFEICSTCIITYLYILINMFDVMIIGFLLSFAISIHGDMMVRLLPVELYWLIWDCMMMSLIISLEVLLGFCAISFVSCRCASVMPFNIHFIISSISTTSGIFAFILEPFVFNHIDNRMHELGLSQKEAVATTLKTMYIVNATVFLGIIPLLQVCRSYISLQFYNASIRIDGKYESLLDQDTDLESEAGLWESNKSYSPRIGDKETYQFDDSNYQRESGLPSWCNEQ